MKKPSLDGKTPMSDQTWGLLKEFEQVLTDPSLKPYPRSQKRERKMFEAIQSVASDFGVDIGQSRINGYGEMKLVALDGDEPGGYGEELAKWLTMTSHRNGGIEYGYNTNPILPESNWAYFQHHSLEQTLLEMKKSAMKNAIDVDPGANIPSSERSSGPSLG